MFGISGYARTGKDTFGEALVKILTRYGIKAKTYALATQLKIDIAHFTHSEFGIDAFTKDDEDKKIIRPLLVGYGEAWRIANPDHWLKILDSNLQPKTLPIITDVRYENEADYILENEGFLLNLSRTTSEGNYVIPANKQEEENAPLVACKSSFLYTWSTTDNENEIEEMVESFIIAILQQDGYIDLWKATYPL
jgi:hypothetical protein